jgi:hypothetical protein
MPKLQPNRNEPTELIYPERVYTSLEPVEEEDLSIPAQLKIEHKTKMMRFFDELDPARDFAGMSGKQDEKIVYTHLHRSIKKKGGHAPKDFNATDLLIDGRKAVRDRDWTWAWLCYIKLKIMTGR